MENTENVNWDYTIKPKSEGFSLGLKELWRYRDLLMMFVRRDIVTVYKQTILGPIWFFLQPVLMTATFVIIFSRVAGIGTNGVPPILFYLSGIVLWTYFSETLNLTSKTFIDNVNIFGKVYFPRLVLPLAKVISGLIKFGIQFLLFIIIYIIYLFLPEGENLHPNIYILLAPVLVFMMGGLGLGFGIITTALTTKYRDLTFLITFGVQLMMYATPIIYPITKISEEHRIFMWLNPFSSILEAFKYAMLGTGELNFFWLGYSALITITVLSIGTYVFRKVERNFVDLV